MKISATAFFVLLSSLAGFMRPFLLAQNDKSTFDADYRLTIAGAAIPQGTLWVYYAGSQYFESYKLADVHAGRSPVVLSSQMLEQNQPAPGDSGLALLVAIEMPGVGWYGPREFANVQELDRAIEGLGQTSSKASHRVDLPAAVPQILRVQNPDGTPRANQEVTLWTFETSIGHCARPTGFGEFRLTSDANGVARFRAPLSKLFLTARYFDATTKEQGRGESLEPGREHVIRKLWEKTRTPARTFKFRLQQPDGKPVTADVVVEGSWDLDGCSTPVTPLGTTNSAGELSAIISLDDAAAIFIDSNDDAKNYRTADEISPLGRSGESTWTGSCCWCLYKTFP